MHARDILAVTAVMTMGTGGVLAAEGPVSVGASRLLVVEPAVFLETCRADIQKAKAEVARLKASDSPSLESYDTAVGLLANAASRASLALNVHPSKELRDAAERCMPEVDAAMTELSLDREVYDVLAALPLDGPDADAATRFYLQKTLREFRRSGVDRDAGTRGKVKELRDTLVKLGQDFGRNIREDVRSMQIEPAELEGLPEDYRRAHPPGPNGLVTITTDNTDYVPFMTYARSASARERLWKLYRLRGHPGNVEVLSRMLETRQELARLLGYATWADYVTEDKMIGTRRNAAEFIERIATAAADRAERDYAELRERQLALDPSAPRVAAWDSGYLQEQVKAERFGFDSQAVRPYFEYERVRQGVMDLTARMFGITYRAVPDATVWHPDVEAFDVVEDGRLRGRIYLDMHPRENKYKHYAQFTLVNGQSGRALPEGVLVCNFPQPGAEPALMLHSDVETFFHEFGHLLHHVLGGDTKWAGISGVATEWDFVEAPSQMLEEWVWDADILRTFARHVETNEPIPADLVRRMKAAEDFGKGLYVRQQMFYAATSLELHSREAAGLDAAKVVAELQERYTPFPFVEGSHFETSFGHLDGYSAIYYTYMWSLVIAKDLFTVFERQGLLDPVTARRYRQLVLEPGGGKPAAELVTDFLGRPYRFDAYEKWLNAN